jgi:virulence-associated protein VagC
MQAIRQTVKVKDHKINITLPDDFNADEVEVIILSKENDFILTNEMKTILDTRSKEDKNTFITAKESIERLKRESGV